MTTDNPASWRRQTAGGIPYLLRNGFPTMSVDEQGAKAVEEYVIRASDIEGFTSESLPAPIVFLGSVIRPPRRHMPGASILRTKTLSYKPLTATRPGDPTSYDSGAPTNTYDDYYIVTINYETQTQDSTDDEENPNDPTTFLEHSVTTGGQHMSVPPNKCETTDADLATAGPGNAEPHVDAFGPIVKTIPTIEHALKWKSVTNPPWSTIRDLLGHVNNATLSLFFDAPHGTVMFMGVSGTQAYLWNGFSTGVQPWELTFKFSERHIRENGSSYGWNWVYVPKHGTWRKLLRANGETLYEESDFLQLFQAS